MDLFNKYGGKYVFLEKDKEYKKYCRLDSVLVYLHGLTIAPELQLFCCDLGRRTRAHTHTHTHTIVKVRWPQLHKMDSEMLRWPPASTALPLVSWHAARTHTAGQGPDMCIHTCRGRCTGCRMFQSSVIDSDWTDSGEAAGGRMLSDPETRTLLRRAILH